MSPITAIRGATKCLLLSLGLAWGVSAAAQSDAEQTAAAESTSVLPAKFQSLDPAQLQLGSVKAAVYDPQSGAMIYQKNAEVAAPIASITKLMTALVVLEGEQPLDEWLTIAEVDRESDKNAFSRIRIGSELPRRDLLLLALMASENLAASNLAHHYPGGIPGFVAAMNKKAEELGMTRTVFADATGLSVGNVSTAGDLVRLVTAASEYPLIREFSTTRRHTAHFRSPRYQLWYGNTNRLVHRGSWDVSLSKTGYLNEAGRCLVMISDIGQQPLVMVFLDSFGKLTPVGDAGRIKRWVNTGHSGTVAGAALNYERSKSASIK